ncbi:signal peptidase II [Alicyclobacillus tolerans]|uniref:signal peptidase II n=1 Tax=Alicyclobacillus tolerans TaxID=90970 RepID=UPI001F022795|nr:signal peptidase II [Alicyclobacillus tolerans]MCF8564446.1 signal peptidase II [Alicyclobacillus tolerans]
MVYALALVVYGLDQWIKWTVRHHMALYAEHPVFPPVLYLDYIRNPGAAFGILPNQRFLLVLIALVVIAFVVYVQRKLKGRWFPQIGLGLVLGGAIGNLSDRLFFGWVTDYVYFKIINFPVFNLADVCIDAGVVILLLYTLLKDRAQTKPEHDKDVAQ